MKSEKNKRYIGKRIPSLCNIEKVDIVVLAPDDKNRGTVRDVDSVSS
jgi:hypothetical protein